jgi:hypothetical protein
MAERSRPDQLRRRIDAGETGDKVPAFDPAAAPLGTDDEAGGLRAAVDDPPSRPAATTPIAADSGRPGTTGVFIASFAAVLAICAGLFLAMML